uniref:Uncharacterized protein n=1 Tax=Lepeophtheirus salmonis TaxID=72036 RepID=A0A0K2VGJ4_LEPSM
MTHPFLNNMCLTYPLILGVVFLSSIGEMIPQGRKYTPINSLTYSQIISQRDNATLKNFDSLSHKELILNFLTRWIRQRDGLKGFNTNIFQLKNQVLNLVADSVIGSQNSNDLIDKYLNNGFDDNMARVRLSSRDLSKASAIFSQTYTSLINSGTKFLTSTASLITSPHFSWRTTTIQPIEEKTSNSFSSLLERVRDGIQKIQMIQKEQERVLSTLQRYRNYNSLNNFQENTHNDDLSPTHSIVRSIQVSSPRVPVSSSDLVTLEKLIYPGKETQKLTNQKVLKFGQYSNIEDRTKFQIVRPDPEKSVSIVKVRRKPLEQWEFFEYYFPKIINQIRSKWVKSSRRKRDSDFLLSNPFKNNLNQMSLNPILRFNYSQSNYSSFILKKPDAVPELITTTTVSPSSSPLPKPIAIQHAANFPLQSFLTTSSSLLFGVKAPTTSIIANPSNGLTSLNKMAIAFGLSLLPTFVILLPFIIPTNRSQRKVRKRRSVS